MVPPLFSLFPSVQWHHDSVIFSLAGTFISWFDPETGLSISLSFRDAAACSNVWYVAIAMKMLMRMLFRYTLSMVMMLMYGILQGHDLPSAEKTEA